MKKRFKFPVRLLPPSLSAQLIVLSVVSVMVVEILILVPSVSRFREDYLKDRLVLAQVISLNMLASGPLDRGVAQQLLEETKVMNIVLHKDRARRLILKSPITKPVDNVYDLRSTTRLQLVRDAIAQLLTQKNQYVRVVGHPESGVGVLIEVQMGTDGLRKAMLNYVRDIMLLSLGIASFVAFMLFWALRYLFVRPVARLVENISSYTQKPEDARRLISLQATSHELREAEAALLSLETELTMALRQKNRLAELGAAVAKISHDLRNILAVAQILANSLQNTQKTNAKNMDHGIGKALPNLMATLTRAINLCESTLVFGKAKEAPPQLAFHDLQAIVREVFDEIRLLAGEAATQIDFVCAVDGHFSIRCDEEQLRRVLFNLVDNACKAASAEKKMRITIDAEEDEKVWRIFVQDTGDGLSEHARKHLFTAFKGGTKREGTGLGLSIAAELVRGHGGEVALAESTPTDGTRFVISLPKELRQ